MGDDLGIRYEADAERDIFGQGDCDAVFLDLAEDLGWLPDLVKHVENMADKSAKLLMDRMKKKMKKIGKVTQRPARIPAAQVEAPSKRWLVMKTVKPTMGGRLQS